MNDEQKNHMTLMYTFQSRTIKLTKYKYKLIFEKYHLAFAPVNEGIQRIEVKWYGMNSK